VQPATTSELELEQAYVGRLYQRLDELRASTRRDLQDIRRRGASGTPQARSERDAFATHYEDRLARLEAVERGLCFGRLDLDTGERHYVGRIGLSDDARHPLLVDWRAPAAQSFYRATPGDPQGLRRRRHLRLKDRLVAGIDDDVFDFEQLTDADRTTLGGDAALMAALTASRTGRMRDIVATIQSEQDEVIRAEADGVLVVQGGPGTGKTAVALHRAAYLLYTLRDRLASSGVLVVGPSPVFLRYIEQVLPSLGETGVLLTTPEQLVPGVDVTAVEPEEVAVRKGSLDLAETVAAAVASRQRVPADDLVVPFEEHDVRLPPAVVAAARARARRSKRPHNPGRYLFAKLLLQELVVRAADSLGDPKLVRQRWLVRALMQADEFREAIDSLWPRLTPQQVVEDLYATRSDALHRRRGSGWTAADVPLLDEALALVGDPDEGLRRADERRRRREEQRYADEVLALTGTRGRVDAERLAARFRDDGPALTLAERAAADPTWAFGHVVVDEAQELSPMAWRMLVRRCPSRSMTVVGDLAQTSSAAGARSWAAVLDPIARGRWRVCELTVNYRTPAEIMAVAADVLRAVDADAVAPAAVREEGVQPWAAQVSAELLADVVTDQARRELDAVGDGTVAVVVPQHLTGLLPEEDRLSVLPARAVKGLEFDSVLVVEPSAFPLRDLYVALTRATRRLGIVHVAPLPDVLGSLARGRPTEPRAAILDR
jgi:DNA helicase IV